jgi:hypothetical protein
MNEPRLNFFTRIYYSIAGFNNYRYFLRQGVGKAVAYLIIIALIVGLVSFIPDIRTYNTVMDELIASFDTSVPDFTLSNGQLKVEGKMPIIIDEGATSIIIDTSDSPNESILDNYDSAILLTKDRMIQKTFVNRRITEFSALQGLTLTKDSIRQSLPLMKPIGLFFFFFGLIFFVCGKFISALLISVVGIILNNVRRTNLSYQSIFKMSVFSLTLPLVLCTILDFFHIPMMWLLFNILAAVYIYGAIHSIRRELDSFNDQFTPQ